MDAHEAAAPIKVWMLTKLLHMSRPQDSVPSHWIQPRNPPGEPLCSLSPGRWVTPQPSFFLLVFSSVPSAAGYPHAPRAWATRGMRCLHQALLPSTNLERSKALLNFRPGLCSFPWEAAKSHSQGSWSGSRAQASHRSLSLQRGCRGSSGAARKEAPTPSCPPTSDSGTQALRVELFARAELQRGWMCEEQVRKNIRARQGEEVQPHT